jgi:ATP/maltotriose-dependent transcriptional regulator MalT/DNA-binding SARP family transcriptional activator
VSSSAASPQERAVIRAKVGVPPLSEAWVGRPRVEQRLAGLIENHRIVAVCATAGAGKTTAVAAAVTTLGRPLAWLTLDWTDAAPGRLLTYLEAALATPVPGVGGVASGALTARIPHPEAAGLLVEAVGDEPVVLVVDELERIADSDDAWAVLQAVARYAPPTMRLVLVSRRRLQTATLARGPEDVALLGEVDLAFTPAEAAAALDQLGCSADAEAAVEATGGWVTGVLFEAWRADPGERGGGDADPLHGYLSAHILGGLPDEDRDFLVGTSLLDVVTVERAQALGYAGAPERLASLQSVHLPVSRRGGGRALRCHPRFREYLLDRLGERPAAEVRALRAAHGRLLAAEGRDEEATEELLAAGDHDEALASAGRAIFGVIDRLDLPVAERWLEQLGPTGPLVMAELMLALAGEDFRRGAALADQLAAAGARAPLAAASSAAALLMGLCYAHLARLDDMRAVFAEAEAQPDPALEVMRYFMSIYSSDPPPPRPALTGGPLDALVLSVDYGYGRLTELVSEQAVGWVKAWAQPWLITALSDTGRTQEAVELYDQVRAHGLTSTSMETVVGPRVLVDAGRREEALETIARGRRRARADGALVYELLSYASEALVALRLNRDPAAALAVLDRLEHIPHARQLVYLAEQIDGLYGLALLLAGRDEEAVGRLRRAVDTMLRSERMLDLPAAAVYLAEAEWRLSDEEAADRAADVALDAARRQGSNHKLLRALADFPAVASRRIDAEPAADSPWHELGRALIAQGVAVEAPVRTAVRLIEFGDCRILVGGDEARPRIAKAYELLAYLAAARPEARAERDELLDALFDGRADESSRSYLRQAVRWLRQVLPEGSVEVEKRHVRLGDAVTITSESAAFEAALVQAARLRGEERLTATLAALEPCDRGVYLPEFTSRWVEERREHLRELATAARYEAAECAYAEGRLVEASQLAAEVLRSEPLREAAWRLTMRLASALGDEDGVLRAYRRCEQALAAVGASPAPTTRQLLQQLRR